MWHQPVAEQSTQLQQCTVTNHRGIWCMKFWPFIIASCMNRRKILFAKTLPSNLHLHNYANANHVQFAAEVERAFKKTPIKNFVVSSSGKLSAATPIFRNHATGYVDYCQYASWLLNKICCIYSAAERSYSSTWLCSTTVFLNGYMNVLKWYSKDSKCFEFVCWRITSYTNEWKYTFICHRPWQPCPLWEPSPSHPILL